MRLRRLAVLAGVLAASACAGMPEADGPSRGTAEICVPMFQDYDRWEQWAGSDFMGEDSLVAPPALWKRGMRLMRADCFTDPDDLDRIATAPRDPVVESGLAIDPIALHAGVVPGIGSEVRARNYFAERGVRVRSVGDVSLGRRIYLGPFATEGGLRAAAQAARDAGFVAPYPKRF